MGPLGEALNAAMRELALFAAAGFLLVGLDDFAVDLVWLARRVRAVVGPRTLPALPPPERMGTLAVFIPAWDEAAVIGRMLGNCIAAWAERDFRLYVGCYPNDPATVAAVRAVDDPRVRLVIGPMPGPTTKADCLNRLWLALLDEEARLGAEAKAVLLHDAEDVVHSAELDLVDRMIERFDLVQLPVVPLIDPGSRFVGGHYADEFAEAHGKDMMVRAALGAALPSAGVGCAFSREALSALAGLSPAGVPFDTGSLTEDYELGLRLRAAGGRGTFVRLPVAPGRPPIATKEFFPGSLSGAVRQKARWIVGIAFAGWDRMGWAGGPAERWMRLRDRRAPLAALLILAGWAAAALWILLALAGLPRAPLPGPLSLLLAFNLFFLLWRLAVRAFFTESVYGWRQALLSVPRFFVGNVIQVAATWQALTRYRAMRRGGDLSWGKTDHAFPAEVPPE